MARAKPDTKLKQSWGLFGGTFDPIHHGHLICAQHVVEACNLDQVLFIPTGNPPHRKTPATPASCRFKMVQDSIEDHPWFEISTIEIDRDGPCYTVQTIRELTEKLPDHEFNLIIGEDELISFTEWKDWQEILEYTSLVGMTRPGFDEKNIPEPVQKHVDLVNGPNIEISAEEIRRRVNENLPIHYLVPPIVHKQIQQENLYRA